MNIGYVGGLMELWDVIFVEIRIEWGLIKAGEGKFLEMSCFGNFIAEFGWNTLRPASLVLFLSPIRIEMTFCFQTFRFSLL